MTKEDAISLAVNYVAANRVEVERLESADFITLPARDESAVPPDILETYLSVRSRWRDHWVVRFRKTIREGTVECPETELLCVYETGEVVQKLSM
jgi:hypothetical protein